MNIADVFASCNASAKLDDLKLLTKDNWEELYPYTTKDFERYEDFCDFVSSRGMKLDNFFFNTDLFYNTWYIDEVLFLEVSNLPKFRLEGMNKKFINGFKQEQEDNVKNNEWTRFFFSLGQTFQVDYFVKHYKEMPKKYQREVLEWLYTSHDYALNTLDIDVVKEVLPKGTASKKLLKYADSEGYLTVYRGSTPKSTPIERAISYTLDLNVAIKFATKFYEQSPRVYKAKVHVDDVRLYTDDRSEQEVIVMYEDVKQLEDIKLFGYKDLKKIEDTFLNSTKYLFAINDRDGIHGVMHSKRMLMYLSLIAKHFKPKLTDAEFKMLELACIVHDLGREHDEEDEEHGLYSVEEIDEALIDIFKLSEMQGEIVKLIVHYHCMDDEYGEQAIQNHPLIKSPKRAIELFRLFKDIDALDRVRLGDLDANRLRYEVSRRVLGVNAMVYKYLK